MSKSVFKVCKRLFSQQVKELIVQQHLDGPHAGVTVLGLNRPQAKNALGTNLVNEFFSALQMLRNDNRSRVVIIRSEVAGVFCSGADLKERANMPLTEVPSFVAKLRQLMLDLEALPMPTIAALDGFALGGGLELALACDLRVAHQSAKMGLVETKLGIIPGAGGTQRLARLICPAYAKELIYCGRIITAAQAHSIGLVNHVVPQQDGQQKQTTLMSATLRCFELAREIAHNGPIAVRMAKRAINGGLDTDLAKAMELEQSCYAEVLTTQDRLEGLQAFSQNRSPNFRGK